MLIIKHFAAYDPKEYKSPWVGRIEVETGDLVYDTGGYTGDYKTGSAGDLYINEPEEGCFYAYGQKENKKKGSSNTQYVYCRFGRLIPVDSTIVHIVTEKDCSINEAVEEAITIVESRIQQLHNIIDDYTDLMNSIDNLDEVSNNDD